MRPGAMTRHARRGHERILVRANNTILQSFLALDHRESGVGHVTSSAFAVLALVRKLARRSVSW